MSARDKKIKEYGLRFVLLHEQEWRERGYTIDYDNDQLVKIA